MTQLSVAPQGFWLKTHFYREGNHINVVAYSCIAGHPEVFRFSIDVRPILSAIVKSHNMLHEQKVSGEEVDAEVSGFFDSITKPFRSAAKGVASAVSSPGRALKSLGSLAVSPAMVMNRGFEMIPGVTAARRAVMNKVSPSMSQAYEGMMGASSISQLAARKVASTSKAKLVSQVSNAVRGAVRTAAGGRIASTSIAFPKVSMSSIASFNSANKALSVIRQADSARAAARKIANKATSSRSKVTLRRALTKWAGATVKSAVAKRVTVPAGMGTIAQAMKLAQSESKKAKARLAAIARKARSGDVRAQQAARIVTLAKSNNDKLRAIKRSTSRNLPRSRAKAPAQLNGFAALLVSPSGRIIPGRYVERAGAPKGIVVRDRKVMRGHFSAVSGDLFDTVGVDYDGDEYIGSIGCSNPFTQKPGHLR